MRKFRCLLSTAVFSILFFSAAVFAALPTVPSFDAAQNYSGPIVVFWNTNGQAAACQYYVIIATNSLSLLTTDQIAGTVGFTGVSPTVTAPFTPPGNPNMYASWTQAVDGQQYFVRLAAVDPYNPTDVVLSPTQWNVTSSVKKLMIKKMYTQVDGVNSFTLNYDSHTLLYYFSVIGDDGVTPFLGPCKVSVDYKTQINPTSILLDPIKLNVTVNVSSSNFYANTDTNTWSGYTYTHAGHKHNGGYLFYATPIDKAGTPNPDGQAYFGVLVDVVHINSKGGLVYVQQNGQTPQPQVNYGPPFIWDYCLSKESFVTLKIYNRNQTEDTSDDKLMRVVVSTVPRIGGDSNATLGPAGWDMNPNQELWDGRDSSGNIVPKDIYRYTMDAIEFWGAPGSGFNPNTTDRTHIEGLLAFDVLRLLNIGSTGITQVTNIAQIKYTLTGTNSAAGGATVKIIICKPGTSFTMASGAGTMSYLNGVATYTYVAGDPVPSLATGIKKIFTFARTAGSQTETWNGLDETGTAVPNDNYVFAISALDDSGNHATDTFGNNSVIIGNITIDRTSAQVATDSVPPTVTSVAVANTQVQLTGGSVITQPFGGITIVLADTGGSGVDLVNTAMILTGPTTGAITTTAANDGVSTIALTFAQQSQNGTYTLRIRARDKAGNGANDVVCTFTLSITQSGQQSVLDESVLVYPNPAKNVSSMNFAYNTAGPTNMKLQIYTMLGELIFEDRWTTTSAGAQVRSWNITNQSQTKLATGVYLYRLFNEGSSTQTKLKKLVIIQ